MIVNAASAFTSLFPDDLLLRIVKLVEAAWSQMAKPPADETENQISLALATAMKAEKKRIGGLPFQVHREIWQDPLVLGKPSFRVDIQLIQGPDEDVYFSFEAKRLNVMNKAGQIKSDAGKYVRQGMYRYVDGSYASGLPCGGMIGYVMDGNLVYAVAAVAGRLPTHQTRLQMASAQLSSSTLDPTNLWLKETAHKQGAERFVIYHLFLPV